MREYRGPYKLATAGMSLWERADWFASQGGLKDPDGLSSRFMCAGAGNNKWRGQKEVYWEDRIVEYYHQGGLGRRIPD
jgi:hypothetical protein